MNYSEKYFVMKEWVENNVFDITELCVLLGVTEDDVLKAFPDKLVSAYGKIFLEEDEADGGIGEEGPDEEGIYFDEDNE